MKKILNIILIPVKMIVLPYFLIRFWSLKGLSKKYSKHGKIVYSNEERYRKINRLISLLLWLSSIKIVIVNKEKVPKKASLLAPNHKSTIDALIMIKVLSKINKSSFPVFVAKQELEKGKYGPALKICDSLFLDRNNIRQALTLFKLAAQNLREGRHVIIFPEGTRIKGPIIGEFKPGAFKIGYQASAPIVPVSLMNTSKAFGSYIFNFPKTIKVVFHDPIPATSYLNINSQILAKKVRDEVLTAFKNFETPIENAFDKSALLNDEVHERIKKSYIVVGENLEKPEDVSVEVIKPKEKNNKQKGENK